jgi:hypothetical protein
MLRRKQLLPLLQKGITVILVMGAIACIAPAKIFSWWAAKADLIVLGYLGLGIICLVLNKKRLMVVSLACCTAICLSKVESPRQQGPKPIPIDRVPERSDCMPKSPVFKHPLNDAETPAKL